MTTYNAEMMEAATKKAKAKKSGGVRYHKGSSADAGFAAAVMAIRYGIDHYLIPTAYGFEIASEEPPAVVRSFIRFSPEGWEKVAR